MSDFLLAAPIPPDGRLQAWTHVIVGGLTVQLQTRWKATSDPKSPWTTPWAPFVPDPVAGGATLPFIDMTAGVLSDGRTQIWGVDSSGAGVVYTSWKVSTAHDSLWTGWSVFNTTSITGDTPIGIAAAALPDKRLQLFIIGLPPALKVWTAWKITTDPKSPWTDFTIL